MDVTVQLVNEFRNVRCDPLFILLQVLIVNTTIITDPCFRSEWMWKPIGTDIALLTAADFTCEMVFAVGHKLFDFV